LSRARRTTHSNPSHQAKLLPVTDAQAGFAKSAVAAFKKAGIRAEIDNSGERLGKMIRNAEQSRTPIICVVGEREVEAGNVAVRSRKGGDMGSYAVADLAALLKRANDEAVEPSDIA
jgi:threonyl-tRNA synthetase